MKTIKQMIEEYISRASWRVRENANSEYSAPGLQQQMAQWIWTQYMLEDVYPPHIAKVHRDCMIHIHDLGFPGAYCAGWDLQQLLLKGFGGIASKQEAAPAQHLRSALGQLLNFIYTMSGEWAGAQAISNFDTLLAPFVYTDKLSYPQVYQAMQEFVFNVNVPTRIGMQTPFSNLTLDLTCPEYFKHLPAIVGGKEFPINLGDEEVALYDDFQVEMDMLNRAFCEVMTAGDAKGRVFTFPIPTYNITKNFNWDAHPYIWEMTARYGLPYFANYINSDLKPSDALSMCCRLMLPLKELRRRAGGLFAASPLTGSIGVVTLNMPHLVYIACDDVTAFYRNVADACDLANEALEVKRDWVEQMFDAGMFPYSRVYLEDTPGERLRNHFSTIGLNGMNEALLNLLGIGIETNTGIEIARATLEIMRAKALEFQERTGNLYNIEATPAEGTCYRFAKHDKARWSDIITAGTLNAPYYTNSTQLPVDLVLSLGDAVKHQDQLQSLYTGGTVHHIYLGENVNAKNAKAIIKTVLETSRLPYVSLTPTFSICTVHKYIPGEHPFCPTCGKTTEVFSRVVGYLRPVSKWNKGKQQEFSDRSVFDVR